MSIPLWQAVLLGAVQGLTEFLPVSSTVHLALVQHFLPGFSQPGILFDVMLHVGTLAAVVVSYRSRIGGVLSGVVSRDPTLRGPALRLVLLLVLAVGCTGVIALPLKRFAVEGMTDFRRMGLALCVTSALLAAAQVVGTRRGTGGRPLTGVRWVDAAFIGTLQAASAVFHGLSRSGNTISMGLFTGLSREASAEFSFLLSIPTILAAAASENIHAWRHGESFLGGAGNLPAYFVGTVVAGLVGYVAVAGLLRLIVAMKLHPFVVYCGALGAFLLFGPEL